MEEFLKKYVKMVAESNNTKLTKDKLNEIVENLMEEEEIWNTLDNYIYDYLED